VELHSTDLIERARGGEEEAFRQLVDPYLAELQVHCYRILASVQDAEDALQETLLSAWRGLSAFEERASMRTWLYRIATSRCLNALRAVRRRPNVDSPVSHLEVPEPTGRGEVFWLEPYPDTLLQGLVDREPGPEARYESREAVSLAFVTALQLLPPRQRVVLILRDVLGLRAAEVADILESSEESVTSALKRARATLRSRHSQASAHEPPPAPGSPVERELVEKLTLAFASGDLDGLVAVLTEDVLVAMPPLPLEYQGRDVAARFFDAIFATGRRFRLVPTRANGQPAFGLYRPDPHTGILHAVGLQVVTLAGDRISGITRFDNGLLSRFGLPTTLRG
jgi:RNA polymerase sigma-70 factor (TIGR02960 family)